MRRFAWALLLVFIFTIPWEYSLDLQSPFGNIARISGLLLLLIAVPAVLRSGQMRRPAAVQWLALALYLWLCLTFFWTAVPDVTLMKLRGYLQEMMIVWLLWEFVESPRDLRALMRAWLAGSWVLAILTIAAFAAAYQGSGELVRFAAFGQDPNDVARFLDLGFPIAALLLDGTEKWPGKLLAVGYFPIAFTCVLLTASRGGFVAAMVALCGCGLLLFRHSARRTLAGVLGLSGIALATWLIAPRATFERIASIADQLQTGDLNQRVNIWAAGWRAFLESPLWGHGAGSFVTAARLAPVDTAHNTILAILVEGGLLSLILAGAIFVISVRSVLATRGGFQITLATLLTVWFISSLVGTVGESRTTWMLLGIIAVSQRFAEDRPEQLEETFPDREMAADLCFAERSP